MKDVGGDFDQARERMVRFQIEGRGIRDERVLEAMRRVPRHLFVPARLRGMAYRDGPLAIGCGQTISQPYIVALMTSLLELKGDEWVLEVGTGSGYQAAVLGLLAREVVTVERVPELAEEARQRLEGLGYRNVRVVVGDGSLGWPEGAPYDAILVTAAAPRVPRSLMEQLGEGGRLVAPVGGRWSQQLVRVWRHGDRWMEEWLEGVAFVPLIGAEGWPDEGGEGG